MKKNRIILLTLILVIIVIICILINNYINANKTPKETVTEEEIFNTGGSERLFTIDKVEDILFDSKQYTKITISMDNNTNLDASMGKYLFEIVDADKEIINVCNFGAYTGNLSFDDMFPDIAKANEITNGALYCPTDNRIAKKLKMSYIVEYINENKEKDVKIGVYYYNIEK